MPLLPTEINDLHELTYDTVLSQRSWNDLSDDKNFYTIVDRFFRGKKVNIKSGPQVTWKLQIANQNTAKWTALYDEDSYEVKNLATTGLQAWAMCTASMTYDVREPDFQSDDKFMLVDAILMREHSMYTDWFKLLETAFWTAPTAAASGAAPQQLCGIPFWLQKAATLGHYGANPSGFASGAGNVDADVYRQWRNGTGTYRTVGRDDFITKLRTMTEFCRFRPAHNYPQSSGAASAADPMYTYYTTFDIWEQCCKYLDARQEAVRDVSGTTGDPMYKSIPISWVPELTDSGADGYDSTNPFYGVNWGAMKLYFQQGREMVRSGPRVRDDSHNMVAVNLDSTLQLTADDRRSSFVLYQA